MSVKVKICGLKSKEAVVASYKADYLGFVFYQKSPRFVNAELAKNLSKISRPSQKKVGLFVNAEEKVIEYISDYVDLDFIQLHGDESIEKIKYIKKKIKKPIIKSIPVSSKKDAEKYKDYNNICDMILFDTKPLDPYIPGGTGRRFNWDLLKEFKFKNEWMLAGGINMLNIQEAIIKTNAPIIDVSSALEDDLGIKSPKKIEEFLNLAKSNKV